MLSVVGAEADIGGDEEGRASTGLEKAPVLVLILPDREE